MRPIGRDASGSACIGVDQVQRLPLPFQPFKVVVILVLGVITDTALVIGVVRAGSSGIVPHVLLVPDVHTTVQSGRYLTGRSGICTGAAVA